MDPLQLEQFLQRITGPIIKIIVDAVNAVAPLTPDPAPPESLPETPKP